MSSLVPLDVGSTVIDNDARAMTAPGVHRRGVVERFDAHYAWITWDVDPKKTAPRTSTRVIRQKIFAATPRVRRAGYTLI